MGRSHTCMLSINSLKRLSTLCDSIYVQFKFIWGDTGQDSDNSYGVMTRKSVRDAFGCRWSLLFCFVLFYADAGYSIWEKVLLCILVIYTLSWKTEKIYFYNFSISMKKRTYKTKTEHSKLTSEMMVWCSLKVFLCVGKAERWPHVYSHTESGLVQSRTLHLGSFKGLDDESIWKPRLVHASSNTVALCE